MAKTAHTAENAPKLASRQLHGAWAIDANYDLRSFLANLKDASPLPRTWKSELKAGLNFPAFANPDGSMVSSMDSTANDIIQDGAVAIIPIKGMMLREARDFEVYYGITSNERLAEQVDRAAADSRIKAIVLTAYSPGGQVAGGERLAMAVKNAAAIKPVIGHAEMAMSLAYYALCNCTEIHVDGATGSAGSIGVMTTITDMSGFWEANGIKDIEVVADGSEDKNRAVNEAIDGKDQRLKDEVLNPLREAFAGAVAEARGAKLKTTKANDPLKGRTYTGAEAVAAGLADGIATLTECIAKAKGTTETQNPDTPPNAMNKFQAAAKAMKEFFGFKEANTEPNAEQITEANAALKAEGLEGMVVVSATQAKALEETEGLRTRATKAEGELATARQALATAEAKASALEAAIKPVADAKKLTAKEGETIAHAVAAEITATDAAIAKALEDNKVTVPEGKSALETMVETMAKWGGESGATHAGGQRSEDPKTDPREIYGSLKAAEAAGVAVGK